MKGFTAKNMLTAMAGVLLSMGVAAAQPYPAKPVTMVVPFPPGGGTDTGSRLLAQKLTERWGQQVIIENRPGAAGNIGLEYVSRAKPDGYVILMGNFGTQSVNPMLYKLPFDPDKAFAPISLVAELPMVLVVNPKLPAATTADIIALAKTKAGDLNYGTSGQGSSMHLAAELFADAAKVQLTHVPYKGGGPAIQDVIGGHINMAFATILETSGHLRAERLRAIAVTGSKRSPALPSIPTIAETALPGYDSISWIGLLAPAGTPSEILDKIAADTKWAMELPDIREKFLAQGATPVGSTAAEFAELIARDKDRYAKIIKEKNITAD